MATPISNLHTLHLYISNIHISHCLKCKKYTLKQTHTHLAQALLPHHHHLGVEALVGFEGLWVVVWVGCH